MISNENLEANKRKQNLLEPEWEMRLSKVRNSFREIFKENKTTYLPLKNFVPHGPEHSEAVEEKIYEMLFDTHGDLNQKEIFCLLA